MNKSLLTDRSPELAKKISMLERNRPDSDDQNAINKWLSEINILRCLMNKESKS